MANLQDIINLANADGGKFFVIDEKGEVRLIIIPVDEYQRLVSGKPKPHVKNVEEINKEIIKAQLAEEPEIPKPLVKGPVVMSDPEISKNDLRAEVIDPSFDFEGPKVEIDDL